MEGSTLSCCWTKLKLICISYFLICYLEDVGATEQTKSELSETLSCVSTALSKESSPCRKGEGTFSGVTGRSPLQCCQIPQPGKF